MDQTTLVAEQLEVGERFLRVVEDYFPVAAATWVFRQDFQDWWLYIASSEVQPGDPKGTTWNLTVAKREFRNPWIDACHLEAIGLSDPLAEQSIQIKDRHPDEKVIPYPVTYFGRMGVENVYVYGDAALPQHATVS